MAQIREIKKRITAVKTIQRITKTMQMIATARFTAALQRAKATQPYSAKIRQLVAEVAAAAGDVEHPLITGPAEPAGKELLLVISSDRGMCGAYNANVLRTAIGHIRKSNAGFDLETAGKKAVGYFRFQRIEITRRHTVGDKPAYDDVAHIADDYMTRFTAGEYDAVRVAFMRFISNSRQVPEVMQLLPLKAEALEETESTGPSGLYEFTPSSAEMLEELLPLTVKTALFQTFIDSAVSEQIMRMVAMKAATENAGGLGKLLKRKYNRARQAQITTELMEVISGAAALE